MVDQRGHGAGRARRRPVRTPGRQPAAAGGQQGQAGGAHAAVAVQHRVEELEEEEEEEGLKPDKSLEKLLLNIRSILKKDEEMGIISSKSLQYHTEEDHLWSLQGGNNKKLFQTFTGGWWAEIRSSDSRPE